MTPKPTPEVLPGAVVCEHCRHMLAEHEAANLSDGQFVGRYLLICPTSVFRAKGYDQFGTPWKKGPK